MYALETLLERQSLIEDIFAELESLIGPRKNGNDEEEEFDELYSKIAAGSTSRDETDIFPRSATEWANLIPEERKRLKLKLLNPLFLKHGPNNKKLKKYCKLKIHFY